VRGAHYSGNVVCALRAREYLAALRARLNTKEYDARQSVRIYHKVNVVEVNEAITTVIGFQSRTRKKETH